MARQARRPDAGELGYDRFDVFGISWGGGLAQQLALQHPRRCRRLVLGRHLDREPDDPGRPACCCTCHPRAGTATPRTPRASRGPSTAARSATSPELAEPITLGYAATGSRRGYLYQLTASAGWTSLPVLRLIRQPTLILAGDDDPIIPLANAG